MAEDKPENSGKRATREDLPDRVGRTVLRHGMFSHGQAVLAAVSGGADSTAMLHALVELSARMALRLGVAYLDHGMRGREASADAEFVASLAAGYQLPFYTDAVDTRRYARRRRLSREEAGRELRYRYLLRTAKRHGYERVAVGHHREDNAETVLMGLLRGGGTGALGGIAAVRADGVVRPMIDLSRNRIRTFLAARGYRFVTDATNSDTRMLRNRVRRQLLPLLTADFNPNMIDTLNRTSDILQQEDQWLDELCRRKYQESLVFSGPGAAALRLSRFKRQPEAARRRVVRLALADVHGNLRRIGHSHVTAILQLAEKKVNCGPLHLPMGIRVKRTGGRLEIFSSDRQPAGAQNKLQPDETPPYSYLMPAPGTLTISQTGDTVRLEPIAPDAVPALAAATSGAAYLDADCLQFPLTVRNFRPGDRFSPLGTPGTQKLKKFFCDHKLDRRRRRACPLLLSAGRVVWVAGMRIDNSVKLTAATCRVMKAELILA